MDKTVSLSDEAALPKPNTGKLGKPFDSIFADWDQAQWAFDLLTETMHLLGITAVDVAPFAVTLPIHHGRLWVHVNYGRWLVFGINGRTSSTGVITLALLRDTLKLRWNHTGDFAAVSGQPAVSLYTLSIPEYLKHKNDITTVFAQTMRVATDCFSTWSQTPYRRFMCNRLAEAILHQDLRDQVLSAGLSTAEMKNESDAAGEEPVVEQLNDEAHYWKISPGRGALLWQDWQQGGYASIAWDDLGDISRLDRKAFELRYNTLLPEHPEWAMAGVNMVWKLAKVVKVGDRIVANHGKNIVLGIGTVIGSYYYIPDIEHRHRIPVRWDRLGERPVSKGHWAMTLLELKPEEFSEIEGLYIPPLLLQPEFTLEQCAEEASISLNELTHWVKAVERKGQAVLYGPPGTGKTYIAEHLAKHLIGGGDGFSELVQFHPEYAYEDFIQGIRPRGIEGGGLEYPLMPGRFKDFCTRAAERTGRCVLIIDEINRANLARVFGELMYLLEYRNAEIDLAAGGRFKIPANVRIIGTMNTADRSIALVDYALRRRFAFLALYPEYDILRKYYAQTGFDPSGLIDLLEKVNKEIGDRNYFIGPSYFLNRNITDHIEDIWRMEIEPYLEEYFFDQRPRYEQFTWDKVRAQITG